MTDRKKKIQSDDRAVQYHRRKYGYCCRSMCSSSRTVKYCDFQVLKRHKGLKDFPSCSHAAIARNAIATTMAVQYCSRAKLLVLAPFHAHHQRRWWFVRDKRPLTIAAVRRENNTRNSSAVLSLHSLGQFVIYSLITDQHEFSLLSTPAYAPFFRHVQTNNKSESEPQSRR